MKQYEVWCASSDINKGMVLYNSYNDIEEAKRVAKVLKSQNKGTVRLLEVITNKIEF